MPYVDSNKVTELVNFIEKGVPAEQYKEIVAMFKSLAQGSLQGEDFKMQKLIAEKFIKDAHSARSALVMKPILAIGYGVNKTRTGERHDLLETILDCGSAIWGSGMFGKSDPGRLLDILKTLIAPEHKSGHKPS